MVQFTLPRNSKVKKGINHQIKEFLKNQKKLSFIDGIQKTRKSTIR